MKRGTPLVIVERRALCGMLLAASMVVAPRIDAFEAIAENTITVCGKQTSSTNGGIGHTEADDQLTLDTTCGPNPGDFAGARTFATATLAYGTVSVRAQAYGEFGVNRARSHAEFSDRAIITNVPDTLDSVLIDASLRFNNAAHDGTYNPGDEVVMFGEVAIPGAGNLTVDRCNPAQCPDNPVEPVYVSERFVVHRNPSTGEFPVMTVRMITTAEAVDDENRLSGLVIVLIADTSGALLSSDSGVLLFDSDGDGIPNAEDNCVTFGNTDQRDSNGDGIGNACDADIVNDCVVNFADLTALKLAFFPNPYDADADLNGDGFVGFGDLGRFKETFFSGPTPGPGPSALPNACRL